jgi:hypothetical protein
MLGPLTVGYALLRVPSGAGSLWEALDAVVSQDPKADRERLVVADSKRVFTRNAKGRARLESSVLAFLGQRVGGEPPRSGAQLVTCAPAGARAGAEAFERHPWYAELAPDLPLWTDAGRLELRAERLRRELHARGITVVDVGVRVMPAGELNRSLARTHNKATSVWECVAAFLGHLFEAHGEEGPSVTLDRQGGRIRYASLLAEDFAPARLAIESERAEESAYRLERGRRRMRITVAERADAQDFSVALASCVAKYARELCMEAFNAWFRRLQPGLRPTAGYTTDGRRWMRDAAPALARASLPEDVLVRRR